MKDFMLTKCFGVKVSINLGALGTSIETLICVSSSGVISESGKMDGPSSDRS